MTKRVKNPVVAVVLAAAAAVVYLLATPKNPGSPPVAPAEAAPALSIPGLEGKPLGLADFKGKVVLVDFWATWCDPCREEIPGLVKLNAKYKERGFVVFGVSMDEDGERAVRKFMRKQPIDYPIGLNSGERAPTGWLVPGLPTAYLIGRDGAVLKRWFGEKDLPEVEILVEAALAGK